MKFIVALMFMMSCCVYASEVNVKLLKVFSNKRQFVIQKTKDISNGKEIFFRTKTISHPKKGRITVCKAKSCLGELEVGIFELDPKAIKSYQVTTEKEGFGDMSLYLGYGSPLGGAIRVGARTLGNEKFNYGVIVGRIDSSSGSTKVKANAISFQGLSKLYETGNWKFNLVGELGWAFSLLEFENEIDKRDVKENTYIVGGSVETHYYFEKFSVSLNFGISKNGFKAEYEAENGKFTNPYGKMLIFSEFGIHYPF